MYADCSFNVLELSLVPASLASLIIQSIASVLLKNYHQRYHTGKRFRLLLCNNLKAKLLVALCPRSYVVKDPSPKNFNSDSGFDDIFTDMGLTEKYKHGLESALHAKLAFKATWLLRKVHSWEPFIPITINGTRRYMWDTNVVMTNLTCFENARDWMQGNRMRDKEEKRREKKKRAGQADSHATQTTQEMPIGEKLALLDLSQLVLPSEILLITEKLWTQMQGVTVEVCETASRIQKLEEEPTVNEHPSYPGITKRASYRITIAKVVAGSVSC
ncbi:uncharacterized protein FSUBG_12400 [Fusarium subglutinans]|uniref:Uncharacterized protein n=1 Tax=Gibberella subglutinans TaxID=42677 RepID=A0A8H5P422_GIBSU|nr:uncharacterized protein FSUBG_12400 [Fusarium subglutinans]KAF5585625.1 hypothetical protein FSUBG_12400 [Fusarium subglutinans]